MFGIGTTELIVVAIIALLLFGNRLPSVMRSLGQGVNEFKRGLNDVQHEFEDKTAIEPPRAESHAETKATLEHPAEDKPAVEKATIEQPTQP